MVLALVVATFVQLASAMYAFETPQDILRDRPLLSYDHGAHHMLGHYLAEAYAESGRLWAFVPQWLSGAQVTGFVEAQGPTVVVAVLSGGRNLGFWLQVQYLLLLGAMPVLLYAAFRALPLERGGSLLGMLLGFLYLNGSFAGLLGRVGDTASFAALYSAPLLFVLLRGFLRSRGMARGPALVIAAPLYVLLHKVSGVILIVPVLALFAVYRRRLTRRVLTWSVIILGATLCLNSFWLPQVFTLLREVVPDTSPFYKTHALVQLYYDYVSPDAFFSPWKHSGMPGLTVLNQLLAIGGLWGLVRLWRDGRRKLAAALSASIVYLFGLAYLGSSSAALGELKLYRAVVPFNLFLILAFVSAADGRIGGLLRGFSRSPWPRKTAVLVLGAALVAGFALTSMFRLQLSPKKIRTRLPPELAELRAWIEEETDTRGRILLEQWQEMEAEGREAPHQLHPCAFLPLDGRLYASGFHPILYSRYAYPDFVQGRLAGRPIEEATDAFLRDYMEVYNVSWVVAWSPVAKARFRRSPELFEPWREIAYLEVFRVRREPSFFLVGQGEIETGINRVRLWNVRPEQGRIVLSLHHFPYLRTEGGGEMARRIYLEDPQGFIEVKDPPEAFEIRNVFRIGEDR